MTDFLKLFSKYNPVTGEISVPQEETVKLVDCKKHDWLFDEFNEMCPLCEAVAKDREHVYAVMRSEIQRTSVGTFDANLVISKMLANLIGENNG